MKIIALLGRVLFGGFFLVNGLGHFLLADMMVPYAAAKGVPAAGALVALSGLMLIGGGLNVLLGAWTRVGLGLLVAFLLVVTPGMHDFWTVADAIARQGELTQFLKNIALLGAALVLLGHPTPWPASVDARRMRTSEAAKPKLNVVW